VLIAPGCDPALALTCSWLAADFAGMEGLKLGSLNERGNRVVAELHVKPEPAQLFLHLQRLEWPLGVLFSGGNDGLQALAEPP